MKFPWEQETHTLTVAELPSQTHVPTVMPTEELVAALQRDFAYAMTNTAVLVHSKHEELQMLVNTPRGQIIPRGECKLTDDSTIEFQDIGMPQIGVPYMTVKELLGEVWGAVAKLGLGVQP